MATIIDVVQTVRHGAPTSCRPGRNLVQHFEQSKAAEAMIFADRCDQCNMIPEWISYGLEIHDELCPGRAACKDHEPGECQCGNKNQ